ncbi:MAG: hypothetical protein PHP43_06065 [Methanoculleus sp.]|nr:hypothetical protein [Methanoculleus sp.]
MVGYTGRVIPVRDDTVSPVVSRGSISFREDRPQASAEIDP